MPAGYVFWESLISWLENWFVVGTPAGFGAMAKDTSPVRFGSRENTIK